MAGVIENSLAQRLLQHAAHCTGCGKELQFALDAIEGREGAVHKGRVTTSEAWQKKFAEEIAAGTIDETSDEPDREME